MASSSSSEIKTCGICSRDFTNQATFIATCSHSFHISCISNPLADNVCPLCHTTYDDEPLLSDPSSSSSTVGALQKVTITAIPERPAVASSESVSQFSVLLKLKAPPLSADARSSQRAPLDLVTVLDVSGSMYGKKLSLLKRAVNFVIDNLGPCDRLSIVSFADHAQRIFRLSRMTDSGRRDAKVAVDSLSAGGNTNIVQGLKKGSQVLEERRYRNPFASIMFLSDGNDTCNDSSWCSETTSPPEYLRLLPPAIFPGNRIGGKKEIETIPVHSFGFGLDHDPVTMHAISDASDGTFSFIESYEMVQDAFASCIGGLLSVVTQGLRLTLRSASHGVEIKSIPSGRYSSQITDQGSKGHVSINDLYADEEKEFLVNLSVPALLNSDEEAERKTSLLDIMCTYMDVVSKETVEIESELVEIRRVKTVSPSDMAVNLEVDRQRNRLCVAESIAEAQKMAETGDLKGARALLSKGRMELFGSAAGQAGDGMCAWLGADMQEAERRMGSAQQYQHEGRAFALSAMSSHGAQRATTKGKTAGAFCGAPSNQIVFGAARRGGRSGRCSRGRGSSGGGLGRGMGGAASSGGGYDPYSTPSMTNMVLKSQQLSKKMDED